MGVATSLYNTNRVGTVFPQPGSLTPIPSDLISFAPFNMVGIKSIAIALPLAASQVAAWGPLGESFRHFVESGTPLTQLHVRIGHATVASVAMQFLLPETVHKVNQILANDPEPFVPKTTTATTPATATAVPTSLSADPVSSFSSAEPSTTTLAKRSSKKIPTLVDIASWADDYRYTPAGAFSAALHYIDAEDEPPKKCNVNVNRDCSAGGCIVSAM